VKLQSNDFSQIPESGSEQFDFEGSSKSMGSLRSICNRRSADAGLKAASIP